MRAVALLAAVVLVASCSQPSPPALPVASPPEAGPPGVGLKPLVIAPTDKPVPAASIGIVPTIDYPLGTGAGTAADGSGKPKAGPSGAPSPGSSPVPSAGPSSVASPTPMPAAGDIRAVLDYQLVSLPGGVTNLSTAANPLVLVYQYGMDPNKLTAEAPGCLRIGIKLKSDKRSDFSTADVAAATVMYTQYDNGGRSVWLGNYAPGTSNLQLSLDVSAVGGRLSFQVKGMLLSDGSGSFGRSSGSNQLFIDWSMKNLSTALPPTPSPDPSASPSTSPSSSSDADFWSNLNSLRR